MEDAVPSRGFEKILLTTVEGEQPISESIIEPAIVSEQWFPPATA